MFIGEYNMPQTEARKKSQKKYQQSEKGKAKRKASQKRYNQSDKFKVSHKRYRQSEKGKEAARKVDLKRKYGLLSEQVDELFIKQDHKCALCKKSLIETKRCIDHDHKTNVIRGILCNNCNAGLGYFNDDPKLLLEAIIYLYLTTNNPYVDRDRSIYHISS